jgi:hypothetical protein
MKRRIIIAGAGTLLAAFLLGALPAFGATVTLRGRLFSNVAGELPYNVKFDIKEFTPPEEALRIVEFMAKGDADGFYKLLRSLDKGNMQFIGGVGLNIKFNIAQEYETEKGYRIILVTEGRSVEPGTFKYLNVPWRFLLIVLDLDKSYNGAGRIYEDAEIGATPSGNFALSSSFSLSKELVNIRLVK